MAKRKKTKKRFQKSSSRPAVRQQQPTAGMVAAEVVAQPTVQSKPVQTVDPRWVGVAGDVKKISVLAAACVVLEVIIWYLLSYTPVGPAVFSLIKV